MLSFINTHHYSYWQRNSTAPHSKKPHSVGNEHLFPLAVHFNDIDRLKNNIFLKIRRKIGGVIFFKGSSSEEHYEILRMWGLRESFHLVIKEGEVYLLAHNKKEAELKIKQLQRFIKNEIDAHTALDEIISFRERMNHNRSKSNVRLG